jgi:flagellar motor component MotA
MWLETLILGNSWLSWKLVKRIIGLWILDVVTMSVLFTSLVLPLVLFLIDFIEGTSERIWRNLVEFILIWESGIHAVFLEEPLESVDALVYEVLEGLVFRIVELLHLLLQLGSLLDE